MVQLFPALNPAENPICSVCIANYNGENLLPECIDSVLSQGIDAPVEILVHDERRESPGLAFMLSRLARGPHEPTPIGVFRDVERPDYGSAMTQQLAAAQTQQGAGDLDKLLTSLPTWTVE